MRISEDKKKLISGANSSLKFDARCCQISMQGNGIYMSTNKQYVIDYYTGLADNEALITFEFNPKNIIFGNIEDVENEFSIKEATIIDIQIL
jgi:hypothetical protein